MFSNIGTTEIIIIAVVVIILFGGRKIPELIRGSRQAVKEYKDAKKDDSNEE